MVINLLLVHINTKNVVLKTLIGKYKRLRRTPTITILFGGSAELNRMPGAAFVPESVLKKKRTLDELKAKKAEKSAKAAKV